MKKYMIRTDMEGVSGIVDYEYAATSGKHYLEGRTLFMTDLKALINGLFAGGADEIYIYDEHCEGQNIDLSALPEHVYVFAGKPPYKPDWAGGLDSSFEAMIMLGLHSKRGTENALLNHTYEPDIADILINDISVGEIGVEAAIAGDVNVPMKMIIGDSEAIREAKELIPGIIGVVVKESLGEYSARCYSMIESSNMIFEAAKQLAKCNPTLDKLYFGSKVKMEFRFFETEYAEKYLSVFGKPEFEANSVLACYSEYTKNKLYIQSLL